ncbi:HtaA domain-containing protein [Rothia mucilaginosa]|uniref:HtaA domain-containing protein n=1 Tax=Rothia mucilaginosa TaxID=43675 RepID=UPI0028D4ED1F|nr:HtaA domain-containing protein [Rothia mucilaginosa]
MSTPSLTKRTWAFLASATIGLGSIAGVPAAFASETNSHVSAGEVAAASEQSLQDVTVNWGLKKSFRSYINGPFSQGSQELTGVTTNEDGSYRFTAAEGTVANGEYSVTFTGSSIHYTAHHGLLEVIISDLSVTIKDGVGTVRANVQSRPYNGNTTPNDLVETKNMTIGTFNASGLKVEGNTITLPSVDEENGTRVKLSEEATGAFAGFYKAGQELDALGFSATIVTKEAPAPAPSTEPSAEPSAAPTAEPTAEPSSAPTTEAPKPAEPTSAAPSAAPTSEAPKPAESSSAAPSSPAATTEPKREEKVTGNVVESGTLSWDIRESFLKYLTSFAHGSVNVDGLEKTAAGGLKYTQASGVYNPETKTGQINFAGTAEFTGHNGQLKSTIKNMRLVVVNGKGTLVADVDALTRDGKSISKTGLAIAEVDLSGASVKDGVFSAQNAAVALTDEGSEVLFAGQYRGSDNAMAPLSFSVKLSEQTAENTVEVPRVSENKSSDNKGSENNSSDNGSSNSTGNSGSNGSAGTSGSVSNGGSSSNGSVSNNPAQPVCVPVTRTREVQEQGASDGTIKSANLGWGVRDSFRNYVRGGIANGSWELNGTSYSSDAFNWSNGTGTFKGGKGSISFSGSVRFTGHHGILDTTIANPRLEINGNTGTLYATMNSNDSSGKATNYGEVALLKVDLSGLQSSAEAVSVNGAATTLTAEGAKAFAGFYEAGKDMAPLSFSAAINGAKTTTKTVSETVYEGEGCDPVTGKPLASTGASGVEGTLVAGFIAVVAGAGTVVYTRRRKKA